MLPGFHSRIIGSVCLEDSTARLRRVRWPRSLPTGAPARPQPSCESVRSHAQRRLLDPAVPIGPAHAYGVVRMPRLDRAVARGHPPSAEHQRQSDGSQRGLRVSYDHQDQ